MIPVCYRPVPVIHGPIKDYTDYLHIDIPYKPKVVALETHVVNIKGLTSR